MPETAKLIIEVDGRGVKRTRDELGRFAKGARKAETATTKLAAAWKNYGKIIGGTAIVLGVRAIINAAVEQEKTLAQLRTGLRSTNGVSGQTIASLRELSAEMQNTTVFSNEMIEAAEGILLSFTQISGEAFPRTVKAAADVATRMGTDLQSAVIQLGKALNDPVQNLGALSRSGIQFTKDQKALIKEMWNTNRAAEAQKIILDELETQYGNSARAARNTLGGAISSLKNEWDDFKKALGEGVSPLLTPALNVAAKGIKNLTGAMKLYVELSTSGLNLQELLQKKIADAHASAIEQTKNLAAARKDAQANAATARIEIIRKSLITEAELKETARVAEHRRTIDFLGSQMDLHAEGTAEHAKLEELLLNVSMKNYDIRMEREKAAAEETKKAADNIAEHTITLGGEITRLGFQWSTSFIDTLFDAEARARLTFESIASGFAKMVVRMMAQQALMAAFGMPSMFGPGSAAAPAPAAAKGAAFGSGRVIPMARGGVVTQPTIFPMARGTGLMGEAGPEAVMPLAKTPKGELGVKAGGTGAEVHVNIINNTGAQVTQRRRQDGQRTELDVVIGNAVDQHLKSGRFDRSMGDAFGVQRRARR